MLDRHGDITHHEISIRQLGDRDALPVAIFGHEQRTDFSAMSSFLSAAPDHLGDSRIR
jgi:hypothetical protein